LKIDARLHRHMIFHGQTAVRPHRAHLRAMPRTMVVPAVKCVVPRDYFAVGVVPTAADGQKWHVPAAAP
jgi:hypothetical protein